jgi:23S rRNA (guanosine2251-2'-O)-methyltransferase
MSEARDRPPGKPGRPHHRPKSGRPGQKFAGQKIDWAARRAEAAELNGPPQIFGFHAVEAALANPARKIRAVHLTENAENRLKPHLEARGLTVMRVTPRDLDRRLGPDTVHQGALLETEELPEPSFKELARAAADRPLIVLDQVTDPHNVGAILRSAAVFGASGLLMTRRHSPPLGGVLAKAASGALELLPIVRAQNLARALDDLRKVGFTLVGLDGEADTPLEAMDWPSPVALVLGAEGKGLRALTRQTCDRLVRIAADGPLGSLNVSNAAAVALHCAALSRRGALVR